jgi:hypothetical protein
LLPVACDRPPATAGGNLALALLVTRVLTNDHDIAVTANDLALVADLLNAGVNLHNFFLVAVFVLLGWVTYGFPLSFAQTAVTFRQPSLREMLFTIYL